MSITGQLRSTGRLLLLLLIQWSNGFAFELVRDGEPHAEIVLVGDAMPQAVLAASELRDHIEQISGARLSIVPEPGGELLAIYIGESTYTRDLGHDLSGIDNEGYKIIATEDYLVLMGRDALFPNYPYGYSHHSQQEKLLQEWQEYGGKKWDFPFSQIHDPRYNNETYGFSLLDPSGTLFAVYDILEGFGVRWYMPHHDFGTVVPKSADLRVEPQSRAETPVFDRRFLRIGWGRDNDVFLWSKRQRLGFSEPQWNCHGTSRVTAFLQDEHPEYLAVVDGKVQNQSAFNQPGQSRLAAPLAEAMASYAITFLNRYPELNHASVGPNDGFIALDDRDRAAGWLHEERGPVGELSDYVWTFINDVAKRVAVDHPDRIVLGLAYSRYREPPENIERFSPNVGVTYCQHRSRFYDVDLKETVFAERERWLEMLPSQEFFVWEYYLWQREGTALWGVPVVFWNVLQEDLINLAGKSKGEYVEAWPLQNRKLWGINHMTIYLTARLYWQPELDLDALLDEYYTLFYGPAADDMRAFFEFAESVWMRPESRDVLGGNGFLKPADVDRYFEILDSATAKVDVDSDYGQRIALVVEDCQPMRDLFAYKMLAAKAKAADEAGNAEEAAGYYRRAISVATDNRERAKAAYALANLYRNPLADEDSALEFYQQAMDANISGAGSAVRSHARMAAVDILRNRGDFDAAIQLLDEYGGSVRHAYWNMRELMARAAIAVDQGHSDAARGYYREALAIDSLSDAERQRLADLLAALSK